MTGDTSNEGDYIEFDRVSNYVRAEENIIYDFITPTCLRIGCVRTKQIRFYQLINAPISYSNFPEETNKEARDWQWYHINGIFYRIGQNGKRHWLFRVDLRGVFPDAKLNHVGMVQWKTNKWALNGSLLIFTGRDPEALYLGDGQCSYVPFLFGEPDNYNFSFEHEHRLYLVGYNMTKCYSVQISHPKFVTWHFVNIPDADQAALQSMPMTNYETTVIEDVVFISHRISVHVLRLELSYFKLQDETERFRRIVHSADHNQFDSMTWFHDGAWYASNPERGYDNVKTPLQSLVAVQEQLNEGEYYEEPENESAPDSPLIDFGTSTTDLGYNRNCYDCKGAIRLPDAYDCRHCATSKHRAEVLICHACLVNKHYMHIGHVEMVALVTQDVKDRELSQVKFTELDLKAKEMELGKKLSKELLANFEQFFSALKEEYGIYNVKLEELKNGDHFTESKFDEQLLLLNKLSDDIDTKLFKLTDWYRDVSTVMEQLNNDNI